MAEDSKKTTAGSRQKPVFKGNMFSAAVQNQSKLPNVPDSEDEVPKTQDVIEEPVKEEKQQSEPPAASNKKEPAKTESSANKKNSKQDKEELEQSEETLPAVQEETLPQAQPADAGINVDQTLPLGNLVNKQGAYKKRETYSVAMSLKVKPSVKEKMDFLTDQGYIKSTSFFINELIEKAVGGIFLDETIRNEFNNRAEWEREKK